MDVTYVSKFGKQKYVHHSIDTYSKFQWVTTLTKEKADAIILHLLEAFNVRGIPHTIKTDNASAYTSQKLKRCFSQWQITHIIGIPYNSQGQAIIECSNRTLKGMLFKQKGGIDTPKMRILRALYTLNF
jgi:transposase InsO family protein